MIICIKDVAKKNNSNIFKEEDPINIFDFRKINGKLRAVKPKVLVFNPNTSNLPMHSHPEREIIWNKTKCHTAWLAIEIFVNGFKKNIILDSRNELLLIEGEIPHQIRTQHAEYCVITTADHNKEKLKKRIGS
ncbi:MAG: hypothetical protein KAQ64_04265 [Candidatus Pacebacteria bacterium]|nr:hypothetical protein [Candidatus Paceibacterota bacterium]